MPRLADKWTFHVIAMLTQAPHHTLRFSELKNGIEGISQKMLTATLRYLERDGFVVRHIFPEVPPRVEYALTEMGQGMIPSMREFMEWMKTSWPSIQESRLAYDRRADTV